MRLICFNYLVDFCRAPVIGEKRMGDRHRCPRAVEHLYMIRDSGGLGHRSLSPHSF